MLKKNQRSLVSLNQVLIENHQDQSLEFSDHLELQDLQNMNPNFSKYNPPGASTSKFTRYPTIEEEESPMS